ncbi:hypothetical protein EDD18DRAFT_757576 [Armillaria luteobubalina]|uniref:DUF6534 domain-containing protein n=1 Tax=Armillaria luteobubalina TaxID=153913 RepID=A0AA39TE42_9AGAR|nr:hypothetical protein EDD18DRAFT_757576 [Armillaria luteobubalina]
MSYHLPSLGKTLGAVYIGAMLSSVLLGITALQAVIYYKKFPHDPWYYRYSVAALWILDMLHVALNTHAIYFYLVDSFGNYLALDSVIWSFKLQVLINVIIVVGVQSLYAVRLWKLGHHFHRVIPWFIVLVIVGGCATGIAMTYDTYQLSHVSSIPTISKTVDGTFATSTSVDFIISGAMFYYLHKSTTITQFESTITLILSLMRVVVISGLATSACSLLALMTFVTLPNTLVFFAIGFILPKLYINSLLAMLNARDIRVKDYRNGGAPQVLQLTSENDSDIGMMERGVGTSLSDSPAVTPHEKF